MRLTGAILVLAAFIVALGANASTIGDVPTFIMTFGGLVALLLFSGADIPGMFRALGADAAVVDMRQAAAAWRNAGAFALAAGGVSTIIGLVIILVNMDDPSGIGPGFAMGSLTSLYGLLLAFAVCMPMWRSLEGRLSD